MSLKFDTLPDLLAHGHDSVIDVRSPAEFAEDHVPGAVNLPVLDDEERARVGTMYKQESPFLARKLGAALVFRNVAAHLEERLSHHDGGWRPLVYCWRGGQRSGTMGWMLKEIGWRSEVVQGGYQTYRRLVHALLYETPFPAPVVLLDGYTGTAKTEILNALPGHGVQVIDLEGLANHRGSLLGEMGGQPAQKAFESALAGVQCALDPVRPVVIEAESSKVGDRIVPPSLWSAMRAAPRIEVQAALDTRARYLALAYADVLADGPKLLATLDPLRRMRGGDVLARWAGLVEAGDKVALTRALMEDHYDPAYATSRRAKGAETVARVQVDQLDAAGVDAAAAQVARLVGQMSFSPGSAVIDPTLAAG